MIYSEIVKRLKKLRIDKNVSIRDLSKKTGIPQDELIQIEGNNKFVGGRPLIKIAHGLGVDLADVILSKK